MNHWHHCEICMEYFECCCNDSLMLSAICTDCRRARQERIYVDSALRDVLRALVSSN